MCPKKYYNFFVKLSFLYNGKKLGECRTYLNNIAREFNLKSNTIELNNEINELQENLKEYLEKYELKLILSEKGEVRKQFLC